MNLLARHRTALILTGAGVCAAAALLLTIARTSGASSLNYAQEIVSPGFLFVFAMCVWLLRNPRSMLPLQALIFVLLLPLLGGICGTALHLADLAFPMKWDAILYRIDEGAGNPAWVLGRWFHDGLGHTVMRQVYEIWGLMVIFTWIMNRLDAKGKPGTLLATYGFNLAAGCCLFLLLPASGPVYAFAGYPGVVPQTDLRLLPVNAFPNSIPSLHMSGALVLWLYASGGARLRWVWVLYAVGTALSTLALGEHYLIDLVLAAPFAGFAASAMERQWNRALAALACVLVWMLAIRWFAEPMVHHPAAVWALAAITVAGSWQLRPQRTAQAAMAHDPQRTVAASVRAT